MRLSHAALIALFAGCATAQPRPSDDADALKELRGQVQAQSAVVAQQQRRIEELEVKLAALVAKAAQRDAPPARPSQAVAPAKDPRPRLRTVKAGGRLPHGDRFNPVERAPALPSTVAFREPDEEALARLDVDPGMAREFGADRAWAEAVQKLNDGRHEEAETDFLAFVAAHPQHTAADNALYLAGLLREAHGDCPGALQLFESVPQKYPAGDAVTQALLERGRCLRILGRKDEAKSVLNQLSREHPDAPETARAQALLQDL
ncbi:MAG: tetratricopeptide repeat protein [Deltaproteobacteria bacterium]